MVYAVDGFLMHNPTDTTTNMIMIIISNVEDLRRDVDSSGSYNDISNTPSRT